MKITFFTICLNGMPWIASHYWQMRHLNFEWEWWIMDGVAKNILDSAWCNSLLPGNSIDGTSEYFASLVFDSRVHYVQKPLWEGKLEMVNYPMIHLKEKCLLWQIDADELWTTDQFIKMREMFLSNPQKNAAYFWCDYWLGPDIKTINRNAYGNNSSYEWHRVWRISPGMRFSSHEPPIIQNLKECPFLHDETENQGLIFDHRAYSTEKQVAFKQQYYGREKGLYVNAVNDWKRLQANQNWPVKCLKEYLPWVDDRAGAVRI